MHTAQRLWLQTWSRQSPWPGPFGSGGPSDVGGLEINKVLEVQLSMADFVVLVQATSDLIPTHYLK